MWIKSGDFDLAATWNSKTMCCLGLCKYGISFSFCFRIREIEKCLENWGKFHLNVLLGGIRRNNTRCKIVYGQTNVGFEWITSELLQKVTKVTTIVSSYNIKQHPRFKFAMEGITWP